MLTTYDLCICSFVFFFSSRRRHTRYWRDWSSDVCSSDLPFDLLVDRIRPDRDTGHAPVFQVSFGMDTVAALDTWEGLRVQRVKLDTGTSRYDLAWTIVQSPDGTHGEVEYSTDLFDRATVVRMTQHWLRLLADATADPGRRLSRLSLLSGQEQAELRSWADGGPPVPHAAATLLDLFAE